MARIHGPLDPEAFPLLTAWLYRRMYNENPDPKLLTQHLPQGVLDSAVLCVDPEDGSQMIALTIQPIRPERLHRVDREAAGPARSRSRYWEPEAVLAIRLALANGGTMFIDEDGKDGNDGEGFHYPEIYGEGIIIHRVFMDAQPGQRVRQHVNRDGALGHHDCRMRHLTIEQGDARSKRGLQDFLDIAARTFAKRNLQDGKTGPERFGVTVEAYAQLLVDALTTHNIHNRPGSAKATAA